ncbi:iron-containing alcohol dehydrogenase [Akkermansia sp. N21169]|jgi:alcohol dehydrogenase YqhD (iron-dependent ADH family)|uniref:iron-containing alcohol dehydrogenase n=1 Tax=Akkermansia sp. N21169 TaxID=3040765 RepID=UPI00244E7A4A|nr:iron-containing alcohol dehydrogenase [Akkermansia sp. N21169]MDH3067927.1 iron-containing alcohol dehydrogenase [Akkermansia sp. N21169]
MLNFVYDNKTRLIFGRGTRFDIASEVEPHSTKILLHYGGGSIKRSGLYDTITQSLRQAGIDYVELGGVKPNPSIALVRQGIDLCRTHDIGFILAVGGGSVIDSAKAIALGVPATEDVWDLFMGKDSSSYTPLPIATVLTIPAAGSESSPNTVISNDETKRKLGHSHPALRPVFSIVDPELFFTLPHNQMANGVCDMMSHIFERYFTNTTHTDLSDSLCEATLRTIMKNACILNTNLHDYDAWAEIAFSGTIAHNNLLGIGREQDWACHAMEHELSALYDIPHGAGLAVVTPAWMHYVYRANPGMFVQFAVNVMNVEGSYRDQDSIIREGINRLQAFFRNLGQPTTMQELGISPEDFPVMANNAINVRGPIGGLMKLDVKDVQNIYKIASMQTI